LKDFIGELIILNYVTFVFRHVYNPGKTGVPIEGIKHMTAKSWFSNYVDEIGEDNPGNGCIYLPPMRKQDVFRHLKLDHTICISSFYSLWQDEVYLEYDLL